MSRVQEHTPSIYSKQNLLNLTLLRVIHAVRYLSAELDIRLLAPACNTGFGIVGKDQNVLVRRRRIGLGGRIVRETG